ncbi:MAG TPA: glycosyltransferase family 4 protein [Balneolaceae bacterium]|nr:glycosyltransferase family 4 protein [Balneolaceae bacterium]
MKIAVLSTIAWRTPPRHYGPWESVASNITEGLVERGHDVTLYATGDSVSRARVKAVCPHGYEEDPEIIPKVWEALHISQLFEEADQYDLIHNHFDFLPLTYSGMTRTPIITTIHGFSSPGILPVYRKYDGNSYYVSISDADRAPDLMYEATVHHGIPLEQFQFESQPDDYLLFFGRIHPDKGVREAIEIAQACNKRLIIAGIIQDQAYYEEFVAPQGSPGQIEYIGSVGPSKRNHLLGKAQAMLHPIFFDEPFGLSVIESMACGTPVIAFNRGSMPELITHGQNGFLVSDMAQAIDAVDKLKDIRREDCRAHVENYFTVDDMVDNYVKVYESVLEKNRNKKASAYAQ